MIQKKKPHRPKKGGAVKKISNEKAQQRTSEARTMLYKSVEGDSDEN